MKVSKAESVTTYKVEMEFTQRELQIIRSFGSNLPSVEQLMTSTGGCSWWCQELRGILKTITENV